MTPAQLRVALAALLTAQLGTYRLPNASTLPAIYVGDPPHDWGPATGLEVRIEPMPEIVRQGVHQGVGLGREFQVRLIPRKGATTAQAAIERIMHRFETSQPATIPQNEGLGILQQYTLRVIT